MVFLAFHVPEIADAVRWCGSVGGAMEIGAGPVGEPVAEPEMRSESTRRWCTETGPPMRSMCGETSIDNNSEVGIGFRAFVT